MAEIFGRIERSTVENGTQVTVFRIPAFSEGLARRRAKVNSRLKGLNNFEIEEPEKVGDGSIPGQSVYDVKVESEN